MQIEAADGVTAIITGFAAQLANPTKPFSLLGRFNVAAGAEGDTEQAFMQAMPETRKEDGAIAFHVHRDAADPTSFVVYEHWRSLNDLEAHLRAAHITRLRCVLEGLIVGTPEFWVLVPTCSSA
jgi:quinol monooxygenase YgiN